MINRAREYGKLLAHNGFDVWHLDSRGFNFLVYQNLETLSFGTFQDHLYDGWEHRACLVPTREYGSGAYLEEPGDQWTVSEAVRATQDTITNDAIGTQRTAKNTWIPKDAVKL